MSKTTPIRAAVHPAVHDPIEIRRPTRWAWLPALPWLLLVTLGLMSARAATVTWDDEAGDGHWETARNWSGDVLPQPGDNVVITTPRNIFVSTSVTVAGLTLAPGIQLNVYGAGVNLSASGATTADGTSLRVSQGARLRLPGLQRLIEPGWLSAEGVGSELDLPALERLEGGDGSGTQIYVADGARIGLGVLRELLIG